jgi:hypothetical protein
MLQASILRSVATQWTRGLDGSLTDHSHCIHAEQSPCQLVVSFHYLGKSNRPICHPPWLLPGSIISSSADRYANHFVASLDVRGNVTSSKSGRSIPSFLLTPHDRS